MDDTLYEDFIEYRQEEAEEGAVVLHKLSNAGVSPEYFRGAMEMLRAIINLPAKKAVTSEQKERAEELRRQMLNSFEVKMMRKGLE
jgi:hypothetical protein